MVVHRGVLKGGPLKVFREGIGLVMNSWWQIRLFVEREHGSYPDPRLKLDLLRHRLLDWFIQSEVLPSVPLAMMKLEYLLSFFQIDIMHFDNSLEEVSEQLVVMFYECLQGDFSSVEIILEANLSLARHLIRPNVLKANSSRVDASQVFRQGICLLMENLWVRRVFIHHSNPHPMLQQLADYILFWFTQTIKPLSFAHLERILRNELYSLPIDYQVATNGITKEVATKLMLMHKECLQGNFSSVEILRGESLNQDTPAAAVPVVSEKSGVDDDDDVIVDYGLRRNREREKNYSKESREEREKIRVEWQKIREREKVRRLEAKDAAMEKSGVDDDDMIVDYGLRGNREREKNYSKESREEREKIRVEWQKMRKKEERWLEAKEADMEKKSKINTDWDRDISEEVPLGYAAKVMYDARLFNQGYMNF